MTFLLVLSFVMVVSVLATFGAGALLGAAWRLVRSAPRLHPWALLAPQLLLAMPVLGLMVALSSLVPAAAWTWFGGVCACQAYGGLHVCPFHFVDAAPLLSVMAPLACVLLLSRLPGVLSAVQRVRDMEHLADAGYAGQDGVVRIDHDGRPMVFVAGVRRPRIIVERTWWATLDARARTVIYAHEQAHVTASDPRRAATLDLMLRLVAPRHRHQVLSDWVLATEMRADAHAAARDGDASYVASVLCRYARAAAPKGALGFGAQELEARVRALLDETTPPEARWPTYARVALLLAACLVGHFAHRLFEVVLSLLA